MHLLWSGLHGGLNSASTDWLVHSVRWLSSQMRKNHCVFCYVHLCIAGEVGLEFDVMPLQCCKLYAQLILLFGLFLWDSVTLMWLITHFSKLFLFIKRCIIEKSKIFCWLIVVLQVQWHLHQRTCDLCAVCSALHPQSHRASQRHTRLVMLLHCSFYSHLNCDLWKI